MTLALTATLALSATGCSLFEKSEAKKEQEFITTLGGVSETYVGTVSTQSYSTPERAANAFVQQQVVGNQQANVVNTKSNGALSQTQIDDLNLPESVQDGIVSVEQMEVEYSTSATTYTNTSTQTKTVTVYVIKYANEWKYYTPAPIVGDTISKSYYDSVFNSEAYANCTFTTTTTANLNLALVVNIDLTMTQTVMHEDGKIFLEQSTYLSALGQEESNYLALYIEETGSSFRCYAKTSETASWQSVNLYQVGFNSLQELTPFYDSYLDYTYFTKTDYGFRMADENAKQYIQQTLAKEDALKEFIGDGSGLNMELFIKYYVCGGVLSGMRQDAKFDLDIQLGEEQMVTVDVSLISETVCKDYGTTSITRPQI